MLGNRSIPAAAVTPLPQAWTAVPPVGSCEGVLRMS